jgi:hypothetical protein
MAYGCHWLHILLYFMYLFFFPFSQPFMPSYLPKDFGESMSLYCMSWTNISSLCVCVCVWYCGSLDTCLSNLHRSLILQLVLLPFLESPRERALKEWCSRTSVHVIWPRLLIKIKKYLLNTSAAWSRQMIVSLLLSIKGICSVLFIFSVSFFIIFHKDLDLFSRVIIKLS